MKWLLTTLIILVALLVIVPMAQANIGVTSTLSYATGATTNTILPVLYKNAYGGWFSGVNMTNGSNLANYVYIQYYDDNGNKPGQLGIILCPHCSNRFTFQDISIFADGTYSATVVAQYPINIVVHTTKEN